MKIGPLYSLLFTLPVCFGASSSSLRGTTLPGLNQSFVLCRMLVIDTLYDEIDSGSSNTLQPEETACIPIIDGLESDHTVPFQLPDDIRNSHKQELWAGNMFVEISNSFIEGSDLLLSPDSRISRREMNYDSMSSPRSGSVTTRELSIAVIRISTKDKPNANSIAALSSLFDTNGTNFVTQFSKCSAGKLSLHRAINELGVVDVTVDSPISNFETGPAELIDAAQIQLKKDLGLDSVTEIADKVLLCLPSGTGNWAASAGMNYWRAQFNENCCTSLSATMHEIGHLIGLSHSTKTQCDMQTLRDIWRKLSRPTTGPFGVSMARTKTTLAGLKTAS